jgi:glycine/D-amino acid oxidase-like deaminating enzyme
LQPETLATRWPGWNAARYADGYFNPAAGWVESGRVMERLLADAIGDGVTLEAGTGFDRLAESGSRVTGVITKEGETIAADTVLVAAGAWTPVLLPWLEPVLWTVAQPVFHLKPADPEPWRPPGFTVWAADIARTGWYGFPASASGIVKIANHGPGRRVHPDAPRTTQPEDEVALRSFLRESLPALSEAPLAASKTCLYCDSFDGDFWIGRDPDRPGLAVAAGDSGHGFKFAPILGAIIADALEGIDTPATRRFAWRVPGTRRTEDARFGMS